MLRTLLAKDLLRARRNPIPWVIQIALPILITTLIGTAFGPKSNPTGLGQIHMLLVDEDNSPMTRFMKGGLNDERMAKNLLVEVVARDEAMKRINANEVAAVVIIPKNFTRDYLVGTAPVRLELIKNPANTIHPTVIEEGLGVLVAGMNATARVFDGEFPTLREAFADNQDIGTSLRAGAKIALEVAEKLYPAPKTDLSRPFVWYHEEKLAVGAPATPQPRSGIFAYLLIGLVAMFLLFISDNASRDFYRELNGRTLGRFRTMRQSLMEFVSAKVVFSAVMVMIGAAIMMLGGAVVFGFTWKHGPQLAVLVIAYALFGTAFMAMLASLAGSERRAAMFNNLLTTGLALGGGCMFPIDGPSFAFWREHVASLFPTYWFVSTARMLQFDYANALWVGNSAKLILAGFVCAFIATVLFRHRMEAGVRV